MRTSSVDLIILNILSKEHTHLTSHEIYQQIHQHLPAVNPSTVYRALERLSAEGKVSVSDMGIGSAVYEAVGGDLHHHLVCQKCHTVTTIPHQEVDHFFHSIQDAHKYQINTNHLILFGLCEYCQHSENTID